MGKTPHYNLNVYSESDVNTKFIDFRVGIAGTDTASNFVILDTTLYEHQQAITALQNGSQAYNVNASYVSGTNYTATISNFPDVYKDDMIIILSLNVNNISSVNLNINNLGYEQVYKINDTGIKSNLQQNDFKQNRGYLCIYGNNGWEVIGLQSADQFNIQGSKNNLVSIGDNGILQDSGLTQSMIGGWNNASALASTETISLQIPVSAWSESNIAEINFPTTDNLIEDILVSPTPNSIKAYTSSGVYCSSLDIVNFKIYFTCDKIPTDILNVGVRILSHKNI